MEERGGVVVTKRASTRYATDRKGEMGRGEPHRVYIVVIVACLYNSKVRGNKRAL